jgi:catechol 2,3-dioxygenase-like lactoylglutathione lyase family enzyme
MNNPIKKITHCTFSCKNYDETVSFYRDTLELKQLFTMRNEDGTPWITYLKVTEKEFIELLNESYVGSNDFKNRGHHHVSLMVKDIQEAARTLEGKGVLLTAGPASEKNYYRIPFSQCWEHGKCGSIAFWVHDPEGNEIEIMQYTGASLQVLNDHC